MLANPDKAPSSPVWNALVHRLDSCARQMEALFASVWQGRDWSFLGRSKSTWYIYWICAVASIANVFQGFDAGIYTTMILDPQFIDDFNLRGPRWRILACMLNLGTILGNIFIAWWFSWRLGRRYTFIFGRIILLCGEAMQAAVHNFGMILTSRIVAGIGTAILSTNLVAYQAEVSKPRYRGQVVALEQVAYQGGLMLAYIVSFGTRHVPRREAWRITVAVQCVSGFLLLFSAFAIPESPRWLLERYPDQPERALQGLSRIRMLPEDDLSVQTEFIQMKDASRRWKAKGRSKGRARLWRDYGIWKRIALGMVTMSLGPLSGTNALMLYATTVYQGLGFHFTSKRWLLNMVSGILGFLASVVATLGIDRFGRRRTLIAGSTTAFTAYMVIAALAEFFPPSTSFTTGIGVMQLMFLFLIQIAYSGALGPSSWIYTSEIFPNAFRDRGVNISQLGQQLTALWLNQAWPSWFGGVMGLNSYWVMMALNGIGVVVVTAAWPETKGKSLEEMDFLFAKDRVADGEHNSLVDGRNASETCMPLARDRENGMEAGEEYKG